jgi:hypothetical protein
MDSTPCHSVTRSSAQEIHALVRYYLNPVQIISELEPGLETCEELFTPNGYDTLNS